MPKTIEERVHVTHHWRDGRQIWVVGYDAPRSRQLKEIKTFDATKDGESAATAAYTFANGFAAGLKEAMA